MGGRFKCMLGRDRRERGVALVAVVVVLVVIATAAADFAYNTQVDLNAAVNARDDLRAHYLSRSGVNLAMLLMRVQQRMIDPNRKFLGGMDLQIADYAPFLVTAFQSKEGAEALGSMLGLQARGIKGLGVDMGSFDLEMESLDGKINLNCGGGTNAGSQNVVRFAASLAALMLPERYNRLFEEADEDGQFADRLLVMRAIIDWADQDTVIFGTSAAEDYRYNARENDPYEIKNHYFDTVEELRLVKGVDDEFMAAFGDAFTVYGGCKVNVNLADHSVIAALIMQHATTPTDQSLRWENVALVARYVVHIREFYGGYSDFKTFVKVIEQPAKAVVPTYNPGDGQFRDEDTPVMQKHFPIAQGIKINQKTLKEAVVVGGPRRIWKIKATSEVGRIKKAITAIWDAKFVSTQSRRHNMGPGGFMYWREE